MLDWCQLDVDAALSGDRRAGDLPCRRIDGTPGGRLTHGVCMGGCHGSSPPARPAMSTSPACPSRLRSVTATTTGITCSSILFLDAHATREQQSALEAIFSGELGGDAATHFPWAWKASEQIAVRSVDIDVEHTRRRQRLLIRDHVSVQIRDRYPGAETVTCIIPGHDREGEELITDRLTVSDGALAFSCTGVCGYGTSFSYTGLPEDRRHGCSALKRAMVGESLREAWAPEGLRIVETGHIGRRAAPRAVGRACRVPFVDDRGTVQQRLRCDRCVAVA